RSTCRVGPAHHAPRNVVGEAHPTIFVQSSRLQRESSLPRQLAPIMPAAREESLLAPVVRSLGQQIAQELRNDIISGRLRDGEPLREVELSRRFGTSRGPIRDALLELTMEGMLVTQRRGGVAVAPAAGDEIR